MSELEHFIGTRAIAGAHTFDVAALESWLNANLPGFRGPLAVEMFKGGQSNPTYKLITPGKSYVMRSKPGPASRLLPSAHAVEREFAVMRSLRWTDVPVAATHCLCEDESVIGRAFYVMEFVQGRVLWDPALPGFMPAERTAIYGEMNRLIDWLPAHIPPGARDEAHVSIVHGDYRLDNLILHPGQPRLLAVLDWELSTLGHPLADFAYHCMTWHILPGVFRGLGGLDLKRLGIPTEADYIRQYCERTDLVTPDALAADWNFYLAYNLFRIAAILQGIAKRAEAGTASSPQAANSATGARPLAQMAWQFAQRA